MYFDEVIRFIIINQHCLRHVESVTGFMANSLEISQTKVSHWDDSHAAHCGTDCA